MKEEPRIPLVHKIIGVVYLVVIVTALIVFRSRLGADFWPFDAARVAPNILATIIQILAITPFVYLLWPPIRRRIHRYITGHVDSVKSEIHKHSELEMAKLEAIHDHIKKTHPLPKHETGEDK